MAGETVSYLRIIIKRWWLIALMLAVTVAVIVLVGSIGGLVPGIKKTKLYTLSPSRNQANRASWLIISLVLLNWIYRLSLGLT